MDKSINNLVDYLDDAAKIKSYGFVLHVPRHRIDTILKTLTFLDERVQNHDTCLILETPASKP